MKTLRIKLKKNQNEINEISLESITHLELIGENLNSFSQKFLFSLTESKLTSLSIVTENSMNLLNIFEAISKIKTLSILKIKNKSKVNTTDLSQNFSGDLKIVTLQGLSLIEFPRFLLKEKNITDLDLSQNKLKSIPDDFFNLASLKRLNLDNNQFEKLPDVLLKMKSISHLSIDHNIFSDEEKAHIQRVLKIWF